MICHPEPPNQSLIRAQLVAHSRSRSPAPIASVITPVSRGKISTQPENRYLRVTPGGLCARQGQVQDRGEPRREVPAALLGPDLPAADIALGYKQLLEVERGWRDMKQILDLRPVNHRLEQRIRAHVVLCWLALLLSASSRPPPATPGTTVRRHLDRLHAGPSRPRRHVPPTHRAVQAPTRPARPPRHPRPEADHRTHHRQAADQRQHHTLETRPRRGLRRVPAGNAMIMTARAQLRGTQVGGSDRRRRR